MKEIISSIKRTPYQSLTAFLVLLLTLFLSLMLFVSLSFINSGLSYLETRPQVTIYFQVKTSEKDIFKVRDELNTSGKVSSIKYISQKDAFNIYKNMNKDNPLLLEMVTSDILPPSLEVYAKKPSFLPEIAEFLNRQNGVDEVQYQKDVIDRLLTFTGILRKGSYVFFAYLILMSIIVLTTTFLFKIALKKDEIELLQLIGASKGYIRAPYIKEGLFLGNLAATITFLTLMGIILFINPFLSSYLSGIPKLTFNVSTFEIIVWPLNPIFFAVVYVISLFFGSAISYISSLIATNKYLKV